MGQKGHERVKALPYLIRFFFAYHPIIFDLRDASLSNELAHHLPLVVILAFYLAYEKRGELAKKLFSPGPQGNGGCMLAGLLANLIGQLGGVYYLAQLSMPVTIYGTLRYLIGKDFAMSLKIPLLFLLLAFPIPGKVYINLVFPLKLLVSYLAGVVLKFMGFNVSVQGSVIVLPPLYLGVEDACSGLNSLLALVTLAAFCGMTFLQRWSSRVVILFMVLPVIIFANVLRVTLSAYIAWTWGVDLIEGYFHTAWGLLVFAISTVILVGAVIFLARREGKKNASG